MRRLADLVTRAGAMSQDRVVAALSCMGNLSMRQAAAVLRPGNALNQLQSRFAGTESAEITLYSWTHSEQPDQEDIVGLGTMMLPGGPGWLNLAVISRRMAERGQRRAGSSAIGAIVREMAEPRRTELADGKACLREPDPRWFIELLGGVADEVGPLEDPATDITWTGVTDLRRARARSPHELRLPLGRWQGLPLHPAGRRARRAAVGLTASSEHVDIAVCHGFGRADTLTWSAVRFDLRAKGCARAVDEPASALNLLA